MSNKTIVNRTRRDRLRLEVGIDFDTNIEHARVTVQKALAEIVEEDRAAIASPEPTVLVREFGNSAIGLVARIWIRSPTIKRRNRVEDAVVCAIKDRFDDAGITIPYPQRVLSGRTPRFRESDVDETTQSVTPDPGKD